MNPNGRLTWNHDDMEGGVTAGLIEKEVEGWRPHHVLRAQRDDARDMAALWKEAARREFQYRVLARTGREFYRGVARKLEESRDAAVQERDEARAEAESLSRQLHDAQQDADMSRAELEGEPRPLTPDAITDETRDRAYRAVAALSVCDWDDMSGVAKGRAMALVEAVITEITRPEPPARPEGAEDMETFLAGLDYMHDETGASRADLATLANDLAMLIVEQP